MIKFKARQSSGRDIVGFGLTEQNIEQLKLGMPVHVDGMVLDLAHDVLIFYGKDEQTIADELKKHGMVDDSTVVTGSFDKKPRS